jgi:arginyl-tRNA synthetase
LEAAGEDIGAIPEGLYPGDYLKAVGEALHAEHGRQLMEWPEDKRFEVVRDVSIRLMMKSIRDDLSALNVRHDVFFSERSLMVPDDRVGVVIERLRDRGHVVEGRLPPPKGTDVEEWEDREQTIFLSTRFGDDVDRALKKSDGSYTYFASDIAYHADKAARGFPLMIDVWGADHGGYVKRMKAAVAAVTNGEASLDVELCQLVRLLRNGEPVRMSKRAGDFITLREVMDEVGVDAVRFIMLTRKSDATLDFDLSKVMEQSKDNPVFYVQYAHSRCCSIARHAEQNLGKPLAIAEWVDVTDMRLLRDEGEIRLIKQICQAPRLLEQAVVAREPHRVAYYLMEVATLLHAQWNKGKDLPELRFMVSGEDELTRARLLLVAAVAAVLRQGLALLGVTAPESMHS